MLAGFLFFYTDATDMSQPEYTPTPDEIASMCRIIRAERLAAMAEQPAPQQDEPTKRKKPSYRRYS